MDPLGLNSKIDFEEVTNEFDKRIEQLGHEWFHRVEAHMDRDGKQTRSILPSCRILMLTGYPSRPSMRLQARVAEAVCYLVTLS